MNGVYFINLNLRLNSYQNVSKEKQPLKFVFKKTCIGVVYCMSIQINNKKAKCDGRLKIILVFISRRF